MPWPRHTSILTFLATLPLASGCEHGGRDADPYAARYLAGKAPHVRSAHAASTSSPVEVATDPQFTSTQATSGAEVYATVCARCHASAHWQGGTFAAGWRDRRLSDFYDLVSQSMPQDAPGTLTPEQYVNVTAYVMQLAGFRSGGASLTADTSLTRHQRLHMATGDTSAKAVPSNAVAPARGGKRA